MLYFRNCKSINVLWLLLVAVYVAFLELLANAQQAMEEEQKQSRLSRLNSSSFRRKGSTGKANNWLPWVVEDNHIS